MYNTDRIEIYLEDIGAHLPLSINGVELGKGWSRGYGGARPHYLRNMGTDNGRHDFDVRSMLINLRVALFGSFNTWPSWDSRER